MNHKFASDFTCTNSADKEFSYANNSQLQERIILEVLPTLDDSLRKTFSKMHPTSTFEVADLGCSSGPNTFRIISQVIESINGIRQQSKSKNFPEIRVFLNDLPGNDFNAVFRSVPGFFERVKKTNGDMVEQPCFIVGVPASFYGRLFPSRSLHFIHSSTCLQWLSKAPAGLENINKGNIYITKSSPAKVLKAYAQQFEEDFSTFLSSRSQELMPGGQMLLTLLGRRNQNPAVNEDCFNHTLLGQSLVQLVSEGLVQEADIDTFNLKVYNPCKEEVYEIIEREGSFVVDKFEIFEVDWVPRKNKDDVESPNGQSFSDLIRAVSEETISCHFGDAIIDGLFVKYAAIVTEHLRNPNNGKMVSLLISMTKK